MFANDLVFALGFVDGNLAAGHDTQPVRRPELQVAKRRPEHESANLRGGIFEREEKVTGIPDLAVRQFAFDPDLEEVGLEAVANPIVRSVTLRMRRDATG